MYPHFVCFILESQMHLILESQQPTKQRTCGSSLLMLHASKINKDEPQFRFEQLSRCSRGCPADALGTPPVSFLARRNVRKRGADDVRRRPQAFNPYSLSIALWAFAKLGHHPGGPFLERVLAACVERLRDFHPKDHGTPRGGKGNCTFFLQAADASRSGSCPVSHPLSYPPTEYERVATPSSGARPRLFFLLEWGELWQHWGGAGWAGHCAALRQRWRLGGPLGPGPPPPPPEGE